jgi:hypothetical protein
MKADKSRLSAYLIKAATTASFQGASLLLWPFSLVARVAGAVSGFGQCLKAAMGQVLKVRNGGTGRSCARSGKEYKLCYGLN